MSRSKPRRVRAGSGNSDHGKSDHTVANPDAPFEGFIALVDNKIKREAPMWRQRP